MVGLANVEETVCSLLHILCIFFIYLGMIKCPTAGSHILPPPNNGVFQAIVALGTHPVYLNPSAHSAVKPWHGGSSSTPILHPCIWQWVGSGGKDVSNEINPKSAWKELTLMACRYMYLTFWLCYELWCIYSFWAVFIFLQGIFCNT